MPSNPWVPSSKNHSKRQRIGPLTSFLNAIRRDTSSTRINNQNAVQNQAVNQTVRGSQIFGNVSIHHGTPTTEPDHESVRLKEGLRESLAFSGMLDRRSNISRPHADTCLWIFDLEQYHRWMRAPRGLLWIKGKPGSGKSTLMSFLYQRLRQEWEILQERPVHLDFFFHARGSELQHSRLGMARSLLSQLLLECPDVDSDAVTSYREKCAAYGGLNGVHKWEWQLPELDRILFDAILEASKRRQIIIFVDALDEAGTKDARAVARYLHSINDKAACPRSDSVPHRLKICISSRHYPVEPIVQSITVCMEDHNTDDINTFVLDEIKQVKLRINYSLKWNHFWDQFASEVLTYANGIFQWVCLVLDLAIREFENGRSIGNTDAFFKNIPRDLEDVYTYILLSVIDQDHVRESLLLFQWVCFACRRLSLKEIKHALASAPAISRTRAFQLDSDEQSMRRYFRSLSGGLIEVTDRDLAIQFAFGADFNSLTSSAVQVIHQSVNEYLLQEGLKLLAGRCEVFSPPLQAKYDLTILIQQSHSVLYHCCLTYIEGLHTAIISSSSDLPEVTGRVPFLLDPDSRKWTHITHPFAIYAALFIFEHARKASQYWSARSLSMNDCRHEIKRLERIRPLWRELFHISARVDGASTTSRFESLLEIAAHFGAANLTQGLIGCGYPVNQVNAVGNTPLHLAGESGFLEVCKLLVSAGADVNVITTSRYSPLACAAKAGQHEVVSWMLEKGANINPRNDGEESALLAAAKAKDIALCRLLIDAGAEVNCNNGGIGTGTALGAAMWNRASELVQLLLEAGADANSSGDGCSRPLQFAVSRQDIEIIHLLINAGADVNAKAGVDAKAGQPCTALQLAAYRGQADIVQVLVDSGADINITGGSYGTALHAAARSGRAAIVQKLIKSGADVNIRAGLYGTALHVAALYGQAKVVQLLVDSGADVNAEESIYGTPLRAARRGLRKELVEILLRAGAKEVEDET